MSAATPLLIDTQTVDLSAMTSLLLRIRMRWREDTGQLFFVAGGTWREGFCGLGTELVVSGAFTKRNIGVVCTTRHGLGEAPAARGGVG